MNEVSPKNLPNALAFGGSALLVAWFLIFFSGDIWGADYTPAAATVVILSLASISGCALTLLLLNWLGRTGKVFGTPLAARFIVLGVLLSAGTVGTVFVVYLPLPVFVIACVLIGCTGAFFICATVLQLAHLSPRNILIYTGGIFLVGILVYSFAYYVPQELANILLCALPLLASLFFAASKEGVALVDSSSATSSNDITTTPNTTATYDTTISPNKATRSLSWRTVVLLSTFMLFSCVVRGYLPLTIDTTAFSYLRSIAIILMLVAAAVVMVVPALVPEHARISNLYRVILIVGVVLFALFPIFGMDNSVALVLADGYRGLCAVIALAFFSCLARELPFFGLKNVCGAMALYASFGIIGWLIGSSLHYLNPGEDAIRIYSSLQCVAVLLAFIILYRQSDLERFIDAKTHDASVLSSSDADNLSDEAAQSNLVQHAQVIDGLRGEERVAGEKAELASGEGAANRASRAEEPESADGVNGAGGRWRQRMHAIAQEKGLTLREEEVFLLLAKGYKAQNISDSLTISYNTTRAHIRNIYQKCDVHSQQEFIELIETS